MGKNEGIKYQTRQSNPLFITFFDKEKKFKKPTEYTT